MEAGLARADGGRRAGLLDRLRVSSNYVPGQCAVVKESNSAESNAHESMLMLQLPGPLCMTKPRVLACIRIQTTF